MLVALTNQYFSNLVGWWLLKYSTLFIIMLPDNNGGKKK